MNFKYHLAAVFTTVVWGTTFVASKSILESGLTPMQTMFFRFIIGYAFTCALCPRKLGFNSWRDELMFAGVGLFGGSMYFMFEYTALLYTKAANVGFICSLVPLQVALIDIFMFRQKFRAGFLIAGSAMALVGVALVVFNGRFAVTLSLIGDTLALAASLCWAIYSFFLHRLGTRFEPLYVTRKLFFYSLISLLPFMLHANQLAIPKSLFNLNVCVPLLYLSLVASLVCLWLWNVSINGLGTTIPNNYLYMLPIITLITSHIILGEEMTTYVILGGLLIISGVWCADKSVVAKR